MEWKKTETMVKTMRFLPKIRFNASPATETMVKTMRLRFNASPATNAEVLQNLSMKQELMVIQLTNKWILHVLNAGLYSLELQILMFITLKSTLLCKNPMIRKIEKLSALQFQTRNNGVEMEKSDKEIRASKFAELMNKHFAASAIPKGIHCLSLRLTDEYSSNVYARRLPSPEFLLLLCDNSYHHFFLASHNILAAAFVVVTSAIQHAVHPEKIIFHSITYKKTCAGMHSWFALNPLSLAIVEVKGVHQFDWLTEENVPVLEAVENFHEIRNYNHGNHFASANLSETTPRKFASKLQARSPKYISILNHLRIYLPEIDFNPALKCMRSRPDGVGSIIIFVELINKHFAASAIPKGIYLLSLRLTDEYSSNVHARRLPSPEFLLLLCDNSYHHFVLASHSILAAASVVVTSAIQHAVHPEKINFHIITYKKTYAGMHSWFALNPLSLAIVEVKGVHQFDWLTEENVPVLEAAENFHEIRNYNHGNHFAIANLSETTPRKFASKLQARSPKYFSILNHLRIYLPELFPNLDKAVFLDDDVLVQRDLSPLEIDLVNGPVETCKGEDEWMMSKHFRNYFNFSHPLIANNLNPDECAWAYGMNVFDLRAWKMTYIRDKYHSWLKENLKMILTMWKLGTIPPALIALRNHVHPIDPSWHLLGLGYLEKTTNKSLQKSAVTHYKTASEYLKRQLLASRLHLCPSHTILLLDLAFHVIPSVAVWSPFVERIEVRLPNWHCCSLSKGADCS